MYSASVYTDCGISCNRRSVLCPCTWHTALFRIKITCMTWCFPALIACRIRFSVPCRVYRRITVRELVISFVRFKGWKTVFTVSMRFFFVLSVLVKCGLIILICLRLIYRLLSWCTVSVCWHIHCWRRTACTSCDWRRCTLGICMTAAVACTAPVMPSVWFVPLSAWWACARIPVRGYISADSWRHSANCYHCHHTRKSASHCITCLSRV